MSLFFIQKNTEYLLKSNQILFPFLTSGIRPGRHLLAKLKKNNTTTEKANKWQKYCHCSVAMEMTAYLHIMATNHNTHTESRKAKQHPFKVFIWRPTSGPASLVFLTPKRRLPFEGKTKRVLKIRDHDAHVHLSALKNTWIKPGQRCQRVNTSLVFQVTSSHISNPILLSSRLTPSLVLTIKWWIIIFLFY